MEVFIVEVDRVYDGKILEYDTEAYSTEEKAEEALEEFVGDERIYCERDGWTIGSDSNDHFLAYLDGDYLFNHTEAVVKRIKVL